MIVGNGLIANSFKNSFINDVCLIFASGVSNSKTIDLLAFDREFEMVKESIINKLGNKTFIYFSSYSINDSNETESLYVKHKLKVENFIINSNINYLIIRTSNIVGLSKNKHTIFNFFYSNINDQQMFDLWTGTIRNFLDVDDLVLILEEMIQSKISSGIYAVINPIDTNVVALVQLIENKLNKRAKVNLIQKENNISCDKSFSIEMFKKKNISTEKYLEKLVDKYLINGTS